MAQQCLDLGWLAPMRGLRTAVSSMPASECPLIHHCAVQDSSAQYLSASANPHVLYGALVAGPSSDDSFTDDRTGSQTGISLEYNGGLSGALALAAGQAWSICQERAGFFDQIGVHHE